MCELCQNADKPFKSNTHYLTDYIIRTALNEDGVNERGKGFYFSIDPRKALVEFRYQQAASPEKLEQLLGRQTTDEENQNAVENIEFSVNDKFCGDCEKVFTSIEEKFHPLLARFRGDNLTDITELIFNSEESKVIRLFFLMQIWRTAICEESFKLSANIMERLRIKIHSQDYEELAEFPLSVTYLETIDSEENNATDGSENFRTGNIVEAICGTNPNIILMNDFYLQFFEDLEFPFIEFYGLNGADYKDFINYQTENFKIKVFSNTERQQLLKNMNEVAADEFMDTHKELFRMLYQHFFHEEAPQEVEDRYIAELKADPDELKFTLEKLHENLNKFLKNL